MQRLKTLFVALPVSLALLAAPAAHAEWRADRGGWHGHAPYSAHNYQRNDGAGLAGALIGLGAIALLGGIIATQNSAPPPPAYDPQPYGYAPAPVYAAPPAYDMPAPPMGYPPPWMRN